MIRNFKQFRTKEIYLYTFLQRFPSTLSQKKRKANLKVGIKIWKNFERLSTYWFENNIRVTLALLISYNHFQRKPSTIFR